jgi:hypothetical protein
LGNQINGAGHNRYSNITKQTIAAEEETEIEVEETIEEEQEIS